MTDDSQQRPRRSFLARLLGVEAYNESPSASPPAADDMPQESRDALVMLAHLAIKQPDLSRSERNEILKEYMRKHAAVVVALAADPDAPSSMLAKQQAVDSFLASNEGFAEQAPVDDPQRKPHERGMTPNHPVRQLPTCPHCEAAMTFNGALRKEFECGYIIMREGLSSAAWQPVASHHEKPRSDRSGSQLPNGVASAGNVVKDNKSPCACAAHDSPAFACGPCWEAVNEYTRMLLSALEDVVIADDLPGDHGELEDAVLQAREIIDQEVSRRLHAPPPDARIDNTPGPAKAPRAIYE